MEKKVKTYKVIQGCNVGCTEDDPQGKRYEIGDTVKDATPAQIKALIELGCIEEK
mgnify:CR=1 FL=1